MLSLVLGETTVARRSFGRFRTRSRPLKVGMVGER
jgi:hypothetical protein